MAKAKAVILMADYGHDPTEVATPFTIFKDAGWIISFATEQGKPPKCDARMLEGLTQKILVRSPFYWIAIRDYPFEFTLS